MGSWWDPPTRKEGEGAGGRWGGGGGGEVERKRQVWAERGEGDQKVQVIWERLIMNVVEFEVRTLLMECSYCTYSNPGIATAVYVMYIGLVKRVLSYICVKSGFLLDIHVYTVYYQDVFHDFYLTSGDV